MNSNRLKLLMVASSPSHVATASTIANRLAGLEYNFLSLEKPIGNLRILEFTWNNSYDIELWDMCGADNYRESGLPPVAFMDTCGFIIVSSEVPKNLLQKSTGLFESPDFPILWLVDDTNYRYSSQETSLSQLNITKVHFTSPSEEIIPSEFNAWISKVVGYVAYKLGV